MFLLGFKCKEWRVSTSARESAAEKKKRKRFFFQVYISSMILYKRPAIYIYFKLLSPSASFHSENIKTAPTAHVRSSFATQVLYTLQNMLCKHRLCHERRIP